MAVHPATIVIPDISGFTHFMHATSLEHSADILCELLNELIAEADVDFSVAEIEGDAILFYIKGQKVPVATLINYCLRAFRRFHEYLVELLPRLEGKAGYQEAANLTVKFIVHWGEVAEMNIVNFKKPVGVELIKAHQLLKNDLDSREYVLITEEYASDQDIRGCKRVQAAPLKWQNGSANYPVIGAIRYHYALLDQQRLSDTAYCQRVPARSENG